jgi:hypothetical protein
MRVAIHQPQYLPWLPYLAKADACDVFVYLDNVQFKKGHGKRAGVQNRNQIKTAHGARWLTVPVNASLGQKISEIRIADRNWQHDHIRSIRKNYAHAPFISLFDEGLRSILEQPHASLCDMNVTVAEWLFGCLDIQCRRIRASELNATGAKDDLVISICKEVGATVYLSGQGARVYLDETKFRMQGIELRYHKYENQPYEQCYPDAGFIPGLSALDLILNVGPRAREVMLAGEVTSRQCPV